MEQSKNYVKEKQKFTIWRIMTYFIIYSIAGFIIETIFALITKGVIESRQSFLYGPFCAIYGVGAVVMIYFLQYFKKNKYTLFVGGFLIGSVVEYFISLVGEYIFNVKWWDYADMPFNVNGRICLAFSLMWGFLAIYLISYFNTKIDKFIEKMKDKYTRKSLKTIIIIVLLFMIFDFVISSYAVKTFFARFVYEHNIDIINKEKYIEEYNQIYSNEFTSNLISKFFSDEKMLKTFPNLKYSDCKGNTIYIREKLSLENKHQFFSVDESEFTKTKKR